MVEIKYTPRTPRAERDRIISDEARDRMRLKKGVKDSPETTIRRIEGRRRLFVGNHPLEEGDLYISWITPKGGRRHAVILEAESLELSRDGEHWLQVVELTNSIDSVSED